MRIYDKLVLIAHEQRVQDEKTLTKLALAQLGRIPHPGDVKMALEATRIRVAA